MLLLIKKPLVAMPLAWKQGLTAISGASLDGANAMLSAGKRPWPAPIYRCGSEACHLGRNSGAAATRLASARADRRHCPLSGSFEAMA